ncbi:N-terminal nucleophile aminohydrolase [Clavulina sp. PMI_390]|nr:N-terminal nucleophile aminohydrolase [Clavulina sp. PMI_390]
MCRWFAYISDSEPALLDDVLVRPAHSITKQVHGSYLPKLFHHTLSKEGDEAERKYIAGHNKFVNLDGTGVAFYNDVRNHYEEIEGARPQLYKTAQPPANDPNFMSLCANQSSKTIFVHIRMATSIVQPTNSHPFVFGRHCFMHNGAIANFTSSLKRRMLNEMTLKAASNVFGSTDSEHLAGLYFSKLGDDWEKVYNLAEMKNALEQAISLLVAFQEEEAKTTGVAVGPSSLNLCTTDGTQLLAFRFRNSPVEEEQPPSLYYSTVAGPTLNRRYEGHPDRAPAQSTILPEEDEHRHFLHIHPHIREAQLKVKNVEGTKLKAEHGRHVIVASEPTTFDQDEWELIPKNTCVMVAADMTVTVDKISVEDKNV